MLIFHSFKNMLGLFKAWEILGRPIETKASSTLQEGREVIDKYIKESYMQ